MQCITVTVLTGDHCWPCFPHPDTLFHIATQVPLFIAQGQRILVDTRTDSYLSKVK